MDKYLQNFTCPIGMDLFDDPITVPCCGQAMSRKPLSDWLNTHPAKKCPLCNGNLSKFNPSTAQTNKNLLNFVEMIKKGMKENESKQSQEQKEQKKQQQQQWSVQINKMNFGNKEMDIAELKLYLNNCLFKLNESLFIIVVDKSGSMRGDPWKQVQTALIHILGITKSNQLIKTIIITYASTAQVLTNPDTLKIKSMTAGGGTNFINSFKQVDSVLKQYINNKNDKNSSNRIKNISVLFLTDGEDTSGPTNDRILSTFNDIIDKYNGTGNIVVHTVGFGRHCDKSFLEKLRTSGTKTGGSSNNSGAQGTFRYSEPSDNDDTLCMKLKSLFREISARSTVNINLKIPKNGGEANLFSFYESQNNYLNEINIAFPLNSDKTGQYSQWIKLNQIKALPAKIENNNDEFKDDHKTDSVVTNSTAENSTENSGNYLILNSDIDKNVNVHIQDKDIVTVAHNKKDKLFNEWIVKLIDQVSDEIYHLSNKLYSNYDNDVFDLHCALLQQRTDVLQVSTKSPELQNKIEYLINAINSLREGQTINLGKISDSRFSSKFTSINNNNAINKFYNSGKTNDKANSNNNSSGSGSGSSRWYSRYSSYVPPAQLIKYSFNNDGMNRNKLQESIMELGYSSDADDTLIKMVHGCNSDELAHKDSDGNNAFLLACYCGRFNVVQAMIPVYLKKVENWDINRCVNTKEETGLELAIKKRGYWKTMQLLFKFGARFKSDALKKSLEKYASSEGYLITAQLIRGFDPENMVAASSDEKKNDSEVSSSFESKLDNGMSTDFIQFLYKNAIKNDIKIDLDNYLHVCLHKQMKNMVVKLLTQHNAVATIDMLLDHCFPPKADSKEVNKYLNLCKLLCENNPKLVYETNKNGDSPLYKACESGNLPIVEYFISKDTIDKANNEGMTPLYISCLKLYPCIMKELIMNNANVNYINPATGNSPLFAVVERVHPNLNPNIANTLLATNKVDFNIVNKNGDSLILVCCRYGHAKVLEYFLNNLSVEDLTQGKRHVSTKDGFNPLIASIYSNCVDAVQVLCEFGMNINEQYSDGFNMGRTPLHVAVLYKKPECVKKLIELGCDVNVTDNNGQIPLTYAILSKNDNKENKENENESNSLQVNMIKLLRNANSNITLKDKFGRTPLSYCELSKNSKEIKKLLVNPAIDILMKLVKGEFVDTNKEKLACGVLRKYIGMCGLLSTKKCVNIIDFDGSTLLMQAILYAKVNMVKLLLELGANPFICNNFGINAVVYAKWNKNVAINKLLQETLDKTQKKENVDLCIKRLTVSSQQCYMNSFILHVLNIPNKLQTLPYNGVESRIKGFGKLVNCIHNDAMDAQDSKEKNNGAAVSFHIEKVFFNINTKDYEAILWHSKLFTLNMIASGLNNNNNNNSKELFAVHVFLINLLSNSRAFISNLNNYNYNKLQNKKENTKSNFENVILALCDGLKLLPNYKGQCYFNVANSVNVDRSKFSIGCKFSWPFFVSTTGINGTCEMVRNDDQENKANEENEENIGNGSLILPHGTTFVISSKTGKEISTFSSFSHENEVVFSPQTMFVVNGWYKGNDLNNKVKIADTARKTFASNENDLIIELGQL